MRGKGKIFHFLKALRIWGCWHISASGKECMCICVFLKFEAQFKS
jgi:hypothetical protein